MSFNFKWTGWWVAAGDTPLTRCCFDWIKFIFRCQQILASSHCCCHFTVSLSPFHSHFKGDKWRQQIKQWMTCTSSLSLRSRKKFKFNDPLRHSHHIELLFALIVWVWFFFLRSSHLESFSISSIVSPSKHSNVVIVVVVIRRRVSLFGTNRCATSFAFKF